MRRFGRVRGEAARSSRGPAVVPLRRRSGAAAGQAGLPGAAADAGGPAGAAASRTVVRRVRIDGYRLAIAVTLIYFIVTFVNQELVMTRLNRQLGSLESELETVRVQQAVLQERIAYLESDSYIVQEARGRFGLAHPGEIRYVIVEDRGDGGAEGGGREDGDGAAGDGDHPAGQADP